MNTKLSAILFWTKLIVRLVIGTESEAEEEIKTAEKENQQNKTPIEVGKLVRFLRLMRTEARGLFREEDIEPQPYERVELEDGLDELVQAEWLREYARRNPGFLDHYKRSRTIALHALVRAARCELSRERTHTMMCALMTMHVTTTALYERDKRIGEGGSYSDLQDIAEALSQEMASSNGEGEGDINVAYTLCCEAHRIRDKRSYVVPDDLQKVLEIEDTDNYLDPRLQR